MGFIGPYYSGPAPWAAGINSFADSFLKGYQTITGKQQQDKALAIQEAYKKMQEQLMAQQIAEKQAAAERQASFESDMRSLPIQKNLSGLMQMGAIDEQSSDPWLMKMAATGQLPGLTQPSTDDYLSVLARYNPEKTAELMVGREKTDATIQEKKTTAEENRKSRESIAEENRKSREQIAEETRKSREDIAAQNRALQRIIIEQKLGEKEQQRLVADTKMRDHTFAELDRLAAQTNALKNHPGLKGITGIMGAVPNIPGSAAANAEALLSTLRSQTAFSVLQTMRQNNSTGGALGQVSDKEGELLQNNLGALDKSQSIEQYQSSLQQILDYTEGAKKRLQSAYDMAWGGGRKSPVQQPQAQPTDFRKKYNY